MEGMRKLRGTKRTCPSCEQRFYDLARDPTVCPSCGASLPIATFERVPAANAGYQRSNWGAPKPELAVVAPPEAEIPEDEAEEATESAEADNDVLLEEDGDDDVGDLLTPDETDSETE
jgi:uncharacterized protein (TIGR02300 family)